MVSFSPECAQAGLALLDRCTRSPCDVRHLAIAPSGWDSSSRRAGECARRREEEKEEEEEEGPGTQSDGARIAPGPSVMRLIGRLTLNALSDVCYTRRASEPPTVTYRHPLLVRIVG